MKSPFYLFAVPWLLFVALCAAQAPSPDERQPSSPGERTASTTSSGFLGVVADDRDEQGRGVRVLDVMRDGPADKAKLKVGDLITAIDGQQVGSMKDFAERMTNRASGTTVTFDLVRGAETLAVDVILGRRPDDAPLPADGATTTPPTPTRAPAAAGARPAPLGVRVVSVGEEARLALGLPSASGARVVALIAGSAAQKAGIPVDAVIVSIDGKRIDTLDDIIRILSQVKVGQSLRLAFYHRGQLTERDVTIEAASEGPAPAARDKPPTAVPPVAPLSPKNQQSGSEAAARIEQLERRVIELERRIAELQASLDKLTKDATP